MLILLITKFLLYIDPFTYNLELRYYSKIDTIQKVLNNKEASVLS